MRCTKNKRTPFGVLLKTTPVEQRLLLLRELQSLQLFLPLPLLELLLELLLCRRSS